jgi:HTH-type transcriptional regulator / antitoxin HipB
MSYYAGMKPAGYTPSPVSVRRADDIAGLIRSRREALGLSQQALADRLTVSRKWVNEIEQGNSNAKLGLVLRALNELGIDIYGQQPGPTTISQTSGQNRRDPINEIDIDAIADMGLTPKRGGR